MVAVSARSRPAGPEDSILGVAPRRTYWPESIEECADILAGEGRLAFIGGGTELAMGRPPGELDAVVHTGRMGRILEYAPADMVMTVEAGVTLAQIQRTAGEERQMLALDPPLGDEGAATIGGVLAAGDSGPLRHRYGAPRDLVLGMTVALSDGTVAKSGGRVIKNVAGYDIAKLFCGSFGTLGLILQVALRLHPLPPQTATAVGRSDDPDALAGAASELAHSSLEKDCLDVCWEDGSGAVLARFGGATAQAQAEAAGELLGNLDVELLEDDVELWQRQRAGQRSADGAVVRVSGLQAELARVMRAATGAGGELVGRAALGLSWIRVQPDRVEELRRTLEPFPCVVLDAPAELRASLDVWDAAQGFELARRIKRRFDPAGCFAPGTFAGGV
jgi:glycolate oxidase FAD binding subunit